MTSDNPTPDLKPCPMCNGKPEYVNENNEQHIWCPECGLRTGKIGSARIESEAYNKKMLYEYWNTRAEVSQPVTDAERRQTLLDEYTVWRIRELVDEEQSGFWHTCSGCHNTEDGHSIGEYPHHPIFNCTQGSGCGECGGIGVIWDNADYEQMAKDMALESALSAQPVGTKGE